MVSVRHCGLLFDNRTEWGKSRAINIEFTCDYQKFKYSDMEKVFWGNRGNKRFKKKLGMKIIAKRNQETRCLDENITTLS